MGVEKITVTDGSTVTETRARVAQIQQQNEKLDKLQVDVTVVKSDIAKIKANVAVKEP